MQNVHFTDLLFKNYIFVKTGCFRALRAFIVKASVRKWQSSAFKKKNKQDTRHFVSGEDFLVVLQRV